MTRSITITIHVDPAEAARLGRAQCGDVALALTDAILADLGPERREALACHLSPPQGAHERVRALWGRPIAHCAPPVGEASVETLARLLDARRGEVEAVEAELAAERAEREELLVWLADGDDAVLGWARARLADDESDHAVRAAVRQRVLDVLVAADVLGPGVGRDLGPGRWGHVHDVPVSLDVYREVVGLRSSVPQALAEAAVPVAWTETMAVHRWRDAEDGEEGDDDGEVLVGEGIDVVVSIRGLDGAVRYRYLPDAD